MGYKVTFESGQSVVFDNEPTQADIEEAESSLGLSAKKPKIDMGAGAAFDANMLSPLLSLSRAFGGADAETQAKAVQQAEEYGQDHEVAAIGGKLTGMLGPMAPVMVAGPAVAAGAGIGGMGMGVLGGAAAAPIVGPALGMEKYQSLINKGAPEEEARNAGIVEGVGNAAVNMIPIPGLNLAGRMAAGALLNTGSTAGMTGIENQLISDKQLHQDPFDLKNLIVAGTLGAVTEGVGGNRPGDAFRATTEEANRATRAKEAELPLQKPSDSLAQRITQIETLKKKIESVNNKLAGVENPTEKQLYAFEANAKKLVELDAELKALTYEKPAVTEPKQTPQDVAMQKMDEATVDNAAKNLERVEQKLQDESISPATRQQLEVEQTVYRELLQDTPKVPEVPDHLRTIDEQIADTQRPQIAGEERVAQDVPDRDPTVYVKEESAPITERPLTPKQTIAKTNYELTKLQRILDGTNKKINEYESGQVPSGTVDIAELHARRASLEQQIVRQEQIRQASLDSVRKMEQKTAVKEARNATNEKTPLLSKKGTSLVDKLEVGARATPEFKAAIDKGDVIGALKSIAGSTVRGELKAVSEALMSKTFLQERKVAINNALKKFGEATWQGEINLKNYNPVVFMHEVIHTITMGRIEGFRRGHSYGKGDRALKSLFTLYDYINTNHKQHMIDTLGEQRTKQVLANEDEFLAHGLVSNDVHSFLNGIKYKKSSGLSELVSKVADLFGFTKTETTALQKLFEVGDKIIAESKGELDYNGKPLNMTNPNEDIGYVDAGFIKNLPIDIGKNLFTAQIPVIWRNNAVVQAVSNIVKQANRVADARTNEILGGSVTVGDYKRSNKLFFTHKKLQTGDGLVPAIIATKYGDIAQVFDIMREGHDLGRSHQDTLNAHGASLNPAQRNLYNAIVRSMDKMHQYENQWRTSVGLQPIKRRAGYFPAIRIGDHQVVFSKNGTPFHVESFMSKAEADRFIAKNKGQFDVTYKQDIEHKSDYDHITRVLADIEQAINKGKAVGDAIAEQKSQLITDQAGTTTHAMHRSGMPGYIGTEIGQSAHNTGKRIADSIEGWAKQWIEGLRKREIIYNRDKYYEENAALVDTMPNAKRLMDFYVDSNVGNVRGPEWVQDAGRWLREKVDAAYQSVFKDNKRTTHFLDRATGSLGHLFYAHTLTMRPAIWVSQVLTYFNSLREIGYVDVSPLQASAAVAKSWATLFRGKYVDQDFFNGVMWTSQKLNTFHPQLTNELTKISFGRDPNSNMNKLTRLVTGETMSAAADSLSRFMTWTTMYHLYKEQGLSGKELWTKASELADDNMLMYGKREQPAVYKHLGMVGEQMTPLKTFAHGQLGLLVADIKHMMQQRTLKSTLPLLLSGGMITIMGGAISAPIITEYELLRKLGIYLKIIDPETFPSAVEWALKQDPAVSHGAVSGATGVDVGASMRYNSLIGGIAQAQDMFDALFPSIGFAANLVTNTTKLALGDLTESEKNQLRKKIYPKGYLGGIVEMDVNKGKDRQFVPMGPGGDALVPHTSKERAAAYMGSRSTEEARASSQNLLNREKTDVMNKRKAKAVDFLIEGNTEKGVELLKKAQVDMNTINNLLKSDLIRRNKPVLDRFVTGNKNTVSSYEQKRRLLDMVGYIEAQQ